MSDHTASGRSETPHHEKPWWAEGLLCAAGGYVFSVLLSAVLVTLAVTRFEPVMALERAGIDLAMKVYVSFPTLLGNVPRSPRLTYAFVDIDEAACRAFSAAAPDACGATKAAPAAAVAAVVDALRASDAKVVIVDVAAPEEPQERQRLTAALTGPSAPWIVASIESRPTANAGEVRADPTKELVAGRSKGRLLLAALTTFSDPSASDGLVRHYPPAVRVLGPGGAEAWLPTAPFLAAALASDGRNAAVIGCMFYGAPVQTCGGRQVLQLGERRFSLAGGHGAIKLARAGVLDRIFYSLPPIDAADADSRTADRYRGLYDRFAVSDFDLSGGKVHMPPHLFDGRVVVVGTSQAAGHDWHTTPVGAMPGSEIVLNATRGFVEFAPAEQGGSDRSLNDRAAEGWSTFVQKLWSTTWMAVATFLPAWLLIAFTVSRTRHKRWPVALAGGVLCAVAFLGALSLSFGLEVFEHSAHLRAEVSEGHTVDLLSPIFGLGLEGYAEASKAVALHIEGGVAALAAFALELIGRKVKTIGRVNS